MTISRYIFFNDPAPEDSSLRASENACLRSTCSYRVVVETMSPTPHSSSLPTITANHWLCVGFREQSAEAEANIFFYEK